MESLGLGIYYSEECLKHTEERESGAAYTYTKMYSICIYCYYEPHLVKVTGTADIP